MMPRVVGGYFIPVTKEGYQRRLRYEFQKYGKLEDPFTIDFLIIRGREHLEEAITFVRTPDHIHQWFFNNVDPIISKQQQIIRSIRAQPQLAFSSPKEIQKIQDSERKRNSFSEILNN